MWTSISWDACYPRGMCPSLQGCETPRYLCKCLFHRFRCRRHFLFQNDSLRFIQNAVARPAISKIQTDRQPLLLENFALEYLHSANLLHRRSPFLVLKSTSIVGSVTHPAGDRPSHPNLVNTDTVNVKYHFTSPITRQSGVDRLASDPLRH